MREFRLEEKEGTESESNVTCATRLTHPQLHPDTFIGHSEGPDNSLAKLTDNTSKLRPEPVQLIGGKHRNTLCTFQSSHSLPMEKEIQSRLRQNWRLNESDLCMDTETNTVDVGE
jgi:hypothetical protein